MPKMIVEALIARKYGLGLTSIGLMIIYNLLWLLPLALKGVVR
jgi:hypothetical protein